MTNQRRSLILIVPGLTAYDERTRLEAIREDPFFEGTHILKVGYSKVKRDGNRIYCGGRLEDYAKNFELTFNQLAGKGEYDSIGVMASSLGATAVTLAVPNLTRNISWYISISPLCMISPQLKEEIFFADWKNGLVMPNPHDKEKGIERVIRRESVGRMLKINLNSKVNSGLRLRMGDILTFVGREDRIADPNESVKYHRLLYGHPENLVIVEAGHDISYEQIENQMKKFLIGKL